MAPSASSPSYQLLESWARGASAHHGAVASAALAMPFPLSSPPISCFRPWSAQSRHTMPYVDGPDGKHFFDVSNDLVGCGHMSGLLVRSMCPRALMKSDDQDPYHQNELFTRGMKRVVPNLRSRPCRSSRLFSARQTRTYESPM
jgi:hypothetical protein